MRPPVQVLVIGFDSPAFSGEVLAELARLREAGVVRLLDLLLVQRGEDGAFETFDAPDEPGGGAGALAAAVLCEPDGDAGHPNDEGLDFSGWSLADVVPPGSVAAVALIEHLWAAPLSAAIARAGGIPLHEAWLPTSELEALDVLVADS